MKTANTNALVGKKVNVMSGLCRGSQGTVTGQFKHNGKELFTVRIPREERNGDIHNTFATVEASGLAVIR